MRISPCCRYNFRGFVKKEPQKALSSFSPDGRVLKNGTVFNRHTTTYFRSDLDWEEFGKYLKNKFSNCNNVQTLIWGCSRGDEAYSLAILLKRTFGEGFKKFQPIKAMDIDSKLIEANKKNKEAGFVLDGTFLEKMQNGLNIKSLRYNMGELAKYCKLVNHTQYRLKDKITDSVEFECSNVLDGVDKIDSNTPAIVMCRNMWPYIDTNRYETFAKRLYNKLADGSIFVIGEYDWMGCHNIETAICIPKILADNGFKFSTNAGAQNSIYIFEK